MRLRAGSICLCLLFTFTAGCHFKKETPPQSTATSAEFAAFADEYFDAMFQYIPTMATAVGVHQYDDKLEDLSTSAVSRRELTLKSFQQRLAALQAKPLSGDDAIDAQLIEGQLGAELLELEVVQGWKKNPMSYVGLPGAAIDGLMKRNFAPPADRLKSVIARLKATPSVFQSMRANLESPPREFTDLAIRIGSGSTGFFRKSVVEWARAAAGQDIALYRAFEEANGAAIQALDAAVIWLKKDLLPRSKGSYAIGAENFSKKLRYEEMVNLPLEKLLAVGEANLDRDYKNFVETAAKIDASKTPAAVMKSLSDDHPGEANLIESARQTLEGARQFLAEHHIISLPSEVRPLVVETPPYARSGSFASMDTPGPYEDKATEAFYYVTPPEKEWDAQHKIEHLRAYNRSVMRIITVHEVYPGHYTQFLYARQFPTKTRKLLACGTNAEGWAHYSEQMMVEEGLGNHDPQLKLAQLSEALLRDCRYVVGIKLHTQGISVEQGAKLFVERGFQEPANAYEEARRGAYNPTYLYYTLGKLQILKLREDLKKARGAAFSLREFHDEFVKQGSLPAKLMRQILLPGNRDPEL
jgi:uncharacterized protein (DUF885 family)